MPKEKISLPLDEAICRMIAHSNYEYRRNLYNFVFWLSKYPKDTSTLTKLESKMLESKITQHTLYSEIESVITVGEYKIVRNDYDEYRFELLKVSD